jgi:uncharacterized protein YbjT (DUF2867 family)
MKALVTGATGFVGRRLTGARRGPVTRFAASCVTAGVPGTEELGSEIREGDVLEAESLRGAGMDRPLIEGLSTPTVVSDPSGAALFDVVPMPFADALRRAREEETASS